MPTLPTTGITSLRDIFRYSNDRVPPDLRHALSLLNMSSLTDLEERFLATAAFLGPWSVYRDSCLLVNNFRDDDASATAITRLDILWFYTQFDEGLRRHDPRSDSPEAAFEIDKRSWGAADHQKHLYAWLLQSLRVGKLRSPFGLQYFELRNICIAWDEVLVPIVNAVCDSYSVKGRRHYGRLALFIEARCPSRLAFPEGNVNMPKGVITSPTPFRMVSKPAHVRGASQTLTKRNYDETEKELREVYPQYGGLVERPRFKQKMEDWLEVQKARAAHRKIMSSPDVVQYVPGYKPHIMQQTNYDLHSVTATKSSSQNTGNRSPIKRYADTIRRSLSNINTSRAGKDPGTPVSPNHRASLKASKSSYGKRSHVSEISTEVM